ncbi:hypothetical protein DY000_02028313 [Brassica cretica]|uniref:Uncharacterized protein n=1 Tax=Brassica cretica TaxID=69181 RepID=A0ABQ7DRQ8_BRACR|nr:hypothetical protein DY000_02028313 [Brassica cretica]
MIFSVIILSVALIMIICFHSYARWLFRRQNRRIRRRIRAHLLSLSPLDPAVLEKIPIFVYSSETHHQSPMEECSVCLSERPRPSPPEIAPVQPEFTEQAAPVQPVEDIETGSSSSSSPSRFPMEACEREPIDLVGLTVEIPVEFEGSINPILNKILKVGFIPRVSTQIHLFYFFVAVSLSRVLRKKDDRRVSASPPSSLVFAVRSSPPSLIRWVYRLWISVAEAGACDNGLRLRSRLQRDVLMLQFMAQFCRSTIPNDFESSRHEQSHESESEVSCG